MPSNEKLSRSWILSKLMRRTIRHNDCQPLRYAFRQSKITRFLPSDWLVAISRRRIASSGESWMEEDRLATRSPGNQRLLARSSEPQSRSRTLEKIHVDSLRSILRVTGFCPKDDCNRWIPQNG